MELVCKRLNILLIVANFAMLVSSV